MALNFNEVYLLTNPSKNFLEARIIAMGVRNRQAVDKDDNWRTCIQFVINSDRGHQIFGKTTLDDIETGVVEMEDLEKISDDGKPVMWRFEPLTLTHWQALGEEGSIGGYAKLKEMLLTIGSVKEYYRDQYVDDWWTEFE